jgi:hypothetical protein
MSNRTKLAVPLLEIRAALKRRLGLRGFELLPDEALAEFMRRHRMRYTGGLSAEMAERFEAETGVWAVMIASVDLYDATVPPKLGLTARLVTAEENPRIVWIDSAIGVGDEAPGAFGTGLVTEPGLLEARVIDALALSASGRGPARKKPHRRFRPAAHYASPDAPILRAGPARIAVLPFANSSTERFAGAILTDQLVRHLVQAGASVIEPGIVRQVMIEARQFYREGPSVPETDLLRLHLEADVVVFGEVSKYQDRLAPRPADVEFLVRALDTGSGDLIWASSSFAGGNKGVYFFGAGRVYSAHALAAELTRALVDTALRERLKVAGMR